MKIGIVGLPNVGKSTLFNALTKTKTAEAANYPFCTIDPNVGIVKVPDKRLDKIADIIKPQKTIAAVTEFVDIAGLVKGASTGEGLGNKFLAHIRECDAIAQLVRVFENNDITHVHESVNPKRDIEIIETELILADLQTVENQVNKFAKEIKAQKKDAKENHDFFCKIKEHLEKGQKIFNLEFNTSEQDILKTCHLLTAKPFLYIANVNENDLNDFQENAYKEKLGLAENDIVVPICAQLEEDLAEMEEDETNEFLQELGIKESGRSQLIRAAYETLGLETYFTAGEKEVRAWTFKKGSSAPVCAGLIHTDFEKGFICADVMSYDDFIASNGWSMARDKGLVRMEGRDYLMQDGDVCLFKFNV